MRFAAPFWLALALVHAGCDGSTPATSCPPLAPEDVSSLTLGTEPSLGMHPGDSRTLTVSLRRCCYTYEPTCLGVQWSLEAGAPATIASDGVLRVDASAAPGSSFTVSAHVDGVVDPLSVDVFVYTTASNPLVGTYRETGRLACGTGTESAPTDPIGELAFRADGTFAVTYQPFELYVDYWGTYAYDVTTGSLALTVTGGNYVPPDLDLAGTFAIAGSSLVLDDLWLGVPASSTSPIECGHRFGP